MMKYFTKVFDKISSCTNKILEEAIQVSQKLLSEAISEHEEENKDKEVKTFNARARYVAFENHLYNVVAKHSKFLDFIHIFVACLASDKHHEMTKHLNSLLMKTIHIVKQMGKY